ncbi:MAG: prolyl-tRNA synthetase [Parcubacteria group bacterium Athens1014_10]|nr:MAG: prolyl-tRNA synthetase [Parcubacteria group bacterium Athens1014_10]TSD04973.1 MAG: prolyl-tRNA synthetase [Parcubacteria group bacterium Athens0714_12]
MNKTKENINSITPRSKDYSKWYLDVIDAAELAENSPVRGCMVIKPNGYAIWENIQKVLDNMFKLRGVKNAYFPLFIPKSFFEKEAEHVEGFAKECAIVTHHRLNLNKERKLVPAGLMEEPLVVRPTSETIIYSMYAKWIHSFRDLPMLINQWANVVRWELRPRPFLRTTEFLWQEGHTAHSTKEEADETTLQMLEVYRDFAEDYLAIPVIKGIKSESEKFAGAAYTACIEAMMQDGKALQVATSHMLGQNFAKPFKVKFTDENGNEQYVWQTSWGMSTRIIGALIMTHSDDKGLIIPPKIAPMSVVIIPIWSKDHDKKDVISKANNIATKIIAEIGQVVHIDERDERPGSKFYDWEKKGIPLRIEIGPRDIINNTIVAVRRDTGSKIEVSLTNLVPKIKELLNSIQSDLYKRAFQYREKMTQEVDSYKAIKNILADKGGFVIAYWCGDQKCESKVKKETTATIRCIPFEQKQEKRKCIICGKETSTRVIFAKAY